MNIVQIYVRRSIDSFYWYKRREIDRRNVNKAMSNVRIVSSSILSIRVCRNCYWLVLLSVCLVTTSSSKPNLQGNKLATTPDPTATSIQKRPNFHLLNEYLKNLRYNDLFSSAVNSFSFFYLSPFLPDLLLLNPPRFDFYGESI